MKTTLLIMAAGIGSRFGGGIKQLEPIGYHDEIIMDYSIHDAIQAGFTSIIIVIRKDIEADFHDRIGKRIEKVCARTGVQLHYAFQDMLKIPDGFAVPEGRVKPWGTGHAVLAAKELIDGPFAVINADDYYGKSCFSMLHRYLEQPNQAYCMAGFVLKNTLSENGCVTRGICSVRDGMLTDVAETSNIMKTADGASADGVFIDPESCVSMNMWGFPSENGGVPDYIRLLEEGFERFFRVRVPQNPLKAEYLLPIHIGVLLREGKIQVKVLNTHDQWFGMTFREDIPYVVSSIRSLISKGVYQEDLHSDLQTLF